MSPAAFGTGYRIGDLHSLGGIDMGRQKEARAPSGLAAIYSK